MEVKEDEGGSVIRVVVKEKVKVKDGGVSCC